MKPTIDLAGLPLETELRKGLADIESGDEGSVEALLLRIAAPRLSRAGFPALSPFAASRETDLELQLHRRLAQPNGDSGHRADGGYRALMQELVSLQCAARARFVRSKT